MKILELGYQQKGRELCTTSDAKCFTAIRVVNLEALDLPDKVMLWDEVKPVGAGYLRSEDNVPADRPRSWHS